MDKSKAYLLWFEQLERKDVDIVGGKSSSLGGNLVEGELEQVSPLKSSDIKIICDYHSHFLTSIRAD